MSEKTVPAVRVRECSEAPIRANGSYVLYWMIAARRARWNFALDRAVELARELGRPLLVLEALRCGHRWASDRIHRFVIDGMRDNRTAFEKSGVAYYPYVEPEHGAARGMLHVLAADACVVVTDDFPCFFLPRMVASAARRLPIRLEAVDSNGLLPLRAAERVYGRAVDFRRFLQRELPRHLDHGPRSRHRPAALPRLDRLPPQVTERWPAADLGGLARATALENFPIDHAVRPVPFEGGSRAGERALRSFLGERMASYGAAGGRRDRAGSGLSPYLHFGHVSPHQILAGLASREEWSTESVARRADGKREGWWGMSPAAEAWLEQLVTWRELGYNFCARRADYDRFASLPSWALDTLEKHGGDPRLHVYTAEQFEHAATHDELWNAAQEQLRTEGRIHNYLRMLWGKKILHWTADPEQAVEIMIELNNKYAIDGRNPNSYSGIFWTLGRYDRPWPERPVFGTVRAMSSRNTRRKMNVDDYVNRWGGAHAAGGRASTPTRRVGGE
ncbi:MAG: deoxyribodipyrimidine photolyase [Candidatus Eiseniibacteriota bacterium]